MEEIWKEIKGYPNYEISNMGNVRKITMLKGREMFGYKTVWIKDKEFKIHRLVASHFIPNPNNLPQVNHKDEVKTNNHVDNLEWCDAKYNINYGSRNEKVSKKLTTGKKSKPVYQYTLDGQFVKGVVLNIL